MCRMNQALLSSKNMCWCTPQDFFDKLDSEFNFVLDPAATNKTAKCALFYTPETDGLSQSWDRGGAADPAPFPSMVVIYNGKNSLPQNNVSGTVPKGTCA